MKLESIRPHFSSLCPNVDFASLRALKECSEVLTLRKGVLEPPQVVKDEGAMITVIHNGGLGYCATQDWTETGLKRAFEKAQAWATFSRNRLLLDLDGIRFPSETGTYQTPVKIAWRDVPLRDKTERLRQESSTLQGRAKIVDWNFSLWHVDTEQIYLTNQGGNVFQKISRLAPEMSITANEGAETQMRSFGGRGCVQQGGMEVLDRFGFWGSAVRLADEAEELLAAPNCPTGTLDLLLAPDQMILQIHESIGHALEIDRILGDERNYAGRSFVTLEDFGRLQYGSPLLNITVDPTQPQEFSSYAFDDEGLRAEKYFIIEKGILKRGLGGLLSQTRSGIPGVANARASSWNRPPIDRIVNLNLEPGTSSLEEMVEAVEDGVYMKTNSSWSIDDSRNKFQFGCEWAQRIQNGKLTRVVRNPNYRSISVPFWNSLKMVGAPDTFDILGTPYCGKGEPNQSIFVGHASPACLFSRVDVFGGV